MCAFSSNQVTTSTIIQLEDWGVILVESKPMEVGDQTGSFHGKIPVVNVQCQRTNGTTCLTTVTACSGSVMTTV